MSKITNSAGLPEAIVRAVQNDSYSKGESDYSTTQLSKPSRIVALEALHSDEITEEAADRLYALIGQLGHSILEKSGTASIVEKRLFAEIEGKILSGQVDVVDGRELQDWKFTSIYSARDGVKKEWLEQANTNCWLCAKNGIDITKATYIVIFRDWSLPKTFREKDYPKQQVQVFNVPLWGLEKSEAWIRERIISHEAARVELPLCTDEERWSRGAKIAVMVKSKKRAVRLLDTEEEAKEYAAQQGISDYKLEKRSAENMRCQFYCSVMPFCSQAKELGVTRV